MESMDARLVAQALNYHGQQLQKVWEGERNENELAMLNLKEPNFEIYQQRQKTLRYSYMYIYTYIYIYIYCYDLVQPNRFSNCKRALTFGCFSFV